jgi:hypothetical protein
MGPTPVSGEEQEAETATTKIRGLKLVVREVDEQREAREGRAANIGYREGAQGAPRIP